VNSETRLGFSTLPDKNLWNSEKHGKFGTVLSASFNRYHRWTHHTSLMRRFRTRWNSRPHCHLVKPDLWSSNGKRRLRKALIFRQVWDGVRRSRRF